MYGIILLRLNFGIRVIFRIYKKNFSVGEHYDIKTILMKKNCTSKNFKYSGDPIFQN